MFVLLEFIPAWAGGPPGNRAGKTLLVLLFSHDGPSITVSHLTQVSISQKMDKLDRYCDDFVCDISGPAEDISYCPLIPLSVAEGDELDVFQLLAVDLQILIAFSSQIVHQEWVYGLPRGGLPYYLGSRANCVVCAF